MLRIVCIQADTAMAANVGGPVQQSCRTFDVDAPEIERWLTEKMEYVERSVIGVEVIDAQRARGGNDA